LQEYVVRRWSSTELADVGGEADEAGERLLTELGLSPADLPVVVVRSGTVLHNPTDEDLDQALGTGG
jgi:hypothetical protein